MLYTLMEALAALICLLPACILLHRFRSRKDSLLYSLFAFYLAAVYHLTGLPTILFVTFYINLNLVPTEIFGEELVLSLLNIAMFVPLGFFLPLLWKKYRRFQNTLLFGLGATVTIELAQLFTYRATDINDIITNFLGACLGWLLFCLLRKCCPKAMLNAGQNRDLPMILLTVLLVMFFLQPLIATFLFRFI